ncbi:hypothetical protein BK130_16480 [Viridibacillus sp. FSL H8-0123]|nr:hypothetical protein BK130_16480 [Viridibacillus sp. FSL H8-0123]
MYITSNLKKIMDERNLGIRECARLCNVNPETIRRLYNDTTRQYQKESLANICEGLKINIEDILILHKGD